MAKKSSNKPIETTEVVQVRRAPKLFAFMITGALIGVLFAFANFALSSAERQAEPGILGLLVVYVGGVGFVAGTLVGLAVDAISRSRAKVAQATKLKA
jgi:ABC-type branched-subunit amino acid transport system permease subunit